MKTGCPAAMVAALVLGMASFHSARAQVAYNNTADPVLLMSGPPPVYASLPMLNYEVGDQIIADASYVGWNLSEFRFLYYMAGNIGDSVDAQIRFYLNAPDPQNPPFWDSGRFEVGITPNEGSFVVFGSDYEGWDGSGNPSLLGSLQLPAEFTWSVQFYDLPTPPDPPSVLLPVYDMQNAGTVGNNYSDYWRRLYDPNSDTYGAWQTAGLSYGGSTIRADFAAEVTVIPEPSTYAMVLFAGFAGIFIRYYRRRESE